jgi:hypothetical protein
MTEPHDDRSQARREAATLLGVDIEHLSAADSLRVDMVSALRLVIDHEQATVLDGREADLGKLNVAVQSLIGLLPGRELPQPASSRVDPREIMWQTYLGMRRRGELAASYLSPQQRLEAARAKVAEIEAELAAGSTAITPPTADIVPPGEIADLNMKPRPGPDDPPKRSPAVIESEYEEVVVSEVVLGQPEPWRPFLGGDGSIMSTPGQKFWGPVGT